MGQRSRGHPVRDRAEQGRSGVSEEFLTAAGRVGERIERTKTQGQGLLREDARMISEC